MRLLTAIQNVNLALRFLLELCALAAFGYWGFQTRQALFAKLALGIGIPLVTAVFWAMFIAPKAVVRLPKPVSFTLGTVILLLAAVALAAAGQLTLAAVFGVIIVINAILMLIWGQ